jgi:hypothetical protein
MSPFLTQEFDEAALHRFGHFIFLAVFKYEKGAELSAPFRH